MSHPTAAHPTTAHPTTALSELVHQRARLGVLAVVHEAERAEFRFLQEALGLTSGNLSRHVQALEEGGLISVERAIQGKRARTWVRITKAGRKALAEEVTQLKRLIAQIETAEAGQPAGQAESTETVQGTESVQGASEG
ncbi:MAG TPA: transcriptional regulator [Actinocrinis sp.]|jgi:DNA-binding MarR family transcriptional regulator